MKIVVFIVLICVVFMVCGGGDLFFMVVIGFGLGFGIGVGMGLGLGFGSGGGILGSMLMLCYEVLMFVFDVVSFLMQVNVEGVKGFCYLSDMFNVMINMMSLIFVNDGVV